MIILPNDKSETTKFDSQEQIHLKLKEKLPLTKTYLSVFRVTLQNPRVELKSGSDKVDVVLGIKPIAIYNCRKF